MIQLVHDEPTHRLVRYTHPDEAQHARSVAAGLAPPGIDHLDLPLVPNRCNSRYPDKHCPICSQAGYVGWRLKEPTNG